MNYWIDIVFGYLLGSVPFGLILGKIFGRGDIRKQGSGGTGATQALRAGGLKLALPVLILDLSKGILAVFYFGIYGGVSAIIGHCFPIWLKFKGGKGLATAGGFVLALSPELFGIAAACWLALEIITRRPSVSMLGAVVSASFASFCLLDGNAPVIVAALCLFILYMHRSNLRNLINGTEKKITFGKK